MVDFTASNQGSTGSLSVFFADGKSKTIPSNHPAYTETVTYLLTTPKDEHDDDHIQELLNPALRIGRALKEIDPKFDFDLYTLSYDGLPLTGPLADLIKERLNSKNPDVERFVRFASSLERNPSYTARQGLYSWVTKHGLHILEDGRFVAHKGVSADGKSAHAGPNNFIDGVLLGKPGESVRVPHFVGTTVSKRRADVDDSRQSCAVGLHIGTHAYATTFVTQYHGDNTGGRFLTVACWPEDVVGGDQSFKIRVSRYEVIALNENRREFEAGDYVHVDHSEEISAFEMKHADLYPVVSKDHGFSDEERAEYNSLPSVGRRLYDNLRTQFAKSHDAAFAAAVETYGTFEEWKAARDAERAAEAAAAAEEARVAQAAEAEARISEAKAKAEAVSVDLAETASTEASERVQVAEEALVEARAEAEQDAVVEPPTEPSSEFTLSDNAEIVPDLAKDLADITLGHKPLARKWSHLTTESSVRRYRKAHGIVLTVGTRVKDALG